MFKTKARKSDDLFQKDPARQNRARGNQTNYDKTKFRRNNIIAIVLGALLSFVFYGLIYGLLFFIISTIVQKLQFKVVQDYVTIYYTKGYLDSVLHVMTSFPSLYFGLSLAIIGAIFAGYKHRKYGKREALKEDHTDINTYTGDRDILSVEEMFKQYEVIPDAGAKSRSVSPTAIVGHAFIDNNVRLNNVKLALRDEHGNIIKDKEGKAKLKSYSLFDSELQKEAYESVGIMDENQQYKFNPFKIKYKKVNGVWKTLGEFINEDWYIPQNEMQRPAGVFFVETAPVNSVAIAITRGNKGQTFVNHSIDMFSREKEIQNMFINDPKGELFSAFHMLLEMRGYEPIVLNLIDPSKTHQFNVLSPAIAMARIGDFDKMRDLLNTIMNTFFPIDGDDPFWGQAQQALVKMIIFSMIDYYIEEERAYINKWSGKRDESTIARDLDEMWGRVTMFNAYQMLTTMSRKEVWLCEKAIKNSDPLTYKEMKKALFGIPKTDEDGEIKIVPFTSKNGHTYYPKDVEQITELSAFFRLMTLLPENKMRTITLQQNDAMNLMAQSEKTTATVYGIALVAMLFFTNGPITAITSASPRQSLDPLSLAFPRRLRFKVDINFLKMHKLNGRRVLFDAYSDETMKEKIIGENKDDFEHETKLDTRGWVEFRFKGIFDNYDVIEEDDGTKTKIPKPVYIRMRIMDDKTGYSMFTYRFEFTRGYARTVDGKRFIHNPRTNQRIEQGGTLRLGELDNEGKFKRIQRKEKLVDGREVLPIEQTDAVYNIRPKAIFSITPPHLADYIKVVIVMVSVLFDTSVGESYITKASGKPFYKTRNILDELGNMQFEGRGIPHFQTKLSIGLGQGQEYTMVLQTLQQLRDVYGESVDKIVSSNTAIFMYLISNDTDMLEALSKQAGTKHVTRTKQKQIQQSVGNVINTVDENVGYQYSTEEEPLFSLNELMSFTNGESMVLSTVHRKDNSGESVRPNPIHNSKETLIPMAYALHKHGHNNDYFKKPLQNVEIATSSTDRDVYQDIPNFSKMYERRLNQAYRTNSTRKVYMHQHDLTEEDLINIERDEISDSIMRLVNAQLDMELEDENSVDQSYLNDSERKMMKDNKMIGDFDISDITNEVSEEDKIHQETLQQAKSEESKKQESNEALIFVDNTLSLNHLKQTGLIQTLLGKAIYLSKINQNKINSDYFNFKVEDNIKRIYTKEGMLVAEIEISTQSTDTVEAWHVSQEFVMNILNIANGKRIHVSNENNELASSVESVDKLFDIDINGVVKKKFIELFKKEEVS